MKRFFTLFVLLFVLLSSMGCTPAGMNEDDLTSDLAGESGTSDPSVTMEGVLPEIGFDENDRLRFVVDGVPVVYEKRARGIGRLTPRDMIGIFTADDEADNDPGKVVWEIYSVEEFLDLEYIVVISETESSFTCLAVKDPAENAVKSERIWDLDQSIDHGLSSKIFVTIPSLGNMTVSTDADKTVYVNGDLLSKDLYWITSFYISDLTGDGCPELCFTKTLGSGISHHYVEIYDAVTRELLFRLSGGLNFDHSLYIEDGDLCVKSVLKGSQNIVRLGKFKCDGSEIYIEWKTPEVEGARIELSYMGDKQCVIPFYEGEDYEYLLNAISAAGGTKGESTKGHYGIPYTLTVYTSEGESYDFHLWSETQYSTSRYTDSEGYEYFFYDDLSKLYKYLDGNFSEEYWYWNREW